MATIAVILSLLSLSFSLSHAHRPIYLHEGGGAVSSIVVPDLDADPAAVTLPLKEETGADASRRPIEFASSVAVPDPDADRALTVPLRLGDEPGVGSDGSRHVALTLRRPTNSRCRQGRHAVSLLLGFPQGHRIPGHFPGRRNFPARPQRLAGEAVDHGGLPGWIPGEEHARPFRNAQEEAVKEKKRFRKQKEEEEKNEVNKVKEKKRFRKHKEEEEKDEVNKEKKKRFKKHKEEEEEKDEVNKDKKKRFRKHKEEEEKDEVNKEKKKRFKKHKEEEEKDEVNKDKKKRLKKHGGLKKWFKKQMKSLKKQFSTFAQFLKLGF